MGVYKKCWKSLMRDSTLITVSSEMYNRIFRTLFFCTSSVCFHSFHQCSLFLSLPPLTYASPCIYFSQRPRRLRFHGDGLRNRSVGGEGVCVIEGEIHLPPEPGHVSEPGAPGPSAHPEPQRLLSQRLEEQQQPALLLQGSPQPCFTVSHCHNSAGSVFWFQSHFHLWINSVLE